MARCLSLSFFTLFLTSLFISTIFGFQQNNITIDGNVEALPFNRDLPGVVVTAKDLDGAVLDVDTTDSVGDYALDVVSTSVGDESLSSVDGLTEAFPNGFVGGTRAGYSLSKGSEVLAEVFDVRGRRVLHKEEVLGRGDYDVKVDGLGAAGVYFLRVSDGRNVYVRKLLNLESSFGGGISFIGGSGYSSFGKVTGSDVDVFFEKDGYEGLVERVLLEDQVLDVDLDKIPLELSGFVGGHLENSVTGEDVSDASVLVSDQDGSSLVSLVSGSDGLFDGSFPYLVWADFGDTVRSVSELVLDVSRDGFEPYSVNEVFSDSVFVDALLDRIPVVADFWLDVYDVSGKSVDSGFSLIFDWNDGSESYGQDGDGRIVVSHSDYSNDASDSVVVRHEDSGFTSWLFGRRIHQSPGQLNLFQNESSWESGWEDFASLSVSSMPDSGRLYLIPKTLPHPFVEDHYITMDGDTLKYILNSGDAATWMNKFVPFEGIDSVDVVQWSWLNGTGEPVDTSYLNQAWGELEKILPLFTYDNGDTLMYFSEPVRVDEDDPRWQDIVDRGLENAVYTRFSVNPQPGFHVEPRFDDPWKGTYRYGISQFPRGQGTYVIFTEIFGSFTGCDDGPNGTNLTSYVRQPGLENGPTDFAKYLVGIVYLLDPQSYFDSSN